MPAQLWFWPGIYLGKWKMEKSIAFNGIYWALHSIITSQQGDSIPGIAHVVAIEKKDKLWII